MKPELTALERFVLVMFSEGHRHTAIATELKCSVTKINRIISRCADKLGVTARGQAFHYVVIAALQQGVIPRPLPKEPSREREDVVLPSWHKGAAA